MEPDFDLLVRDRVRSADRLPLQWRKDLVWQMLSGTQLTKHRTIGRRSLMMAASVLFLLSAVVTTQEESMAPRDLSASAALTPIIKQPLVDIETINVCDFVTNEPSKKETKARQISTQSTYVVDNATSQVKGERFTKKKIASIPASDTVMIIAAQPKREDKQMIKPIIGVYKNNEQPNITISEKKKRRIKFHKQTVPEQNTEYAQSFLARIK